jgi:hypothetical protein
MCFANALTELPVLPWFLRNASEVRELFLTIPMERVRNSSHAATPVNNDVRPAPQLPQAAPAARAFSSAAPDPRPSEILGRTSSRMLFDQQLAQWVDSAPAEERDVRRIAGQKIKRALIDEESSLRLTGSTFEVSLTSLPPCLHLMNKLKRLCCYWNALTELPVLPANLVRLDCYGNALIALPVLPANLRVLMCNSNALTELPVLPANLERLDCSSNALTTLPALPANLRFLNCSSNALTALPVLPANLATLHCTSNALTATPILPSSLPNVDWRDTLFDSMVAERRWSNASTSVNNDVRPAPQLPRAAPPARATPSPDATRSALVAPVEDNDVFGALSEQELADALEAQGLYTEHASDPQLNNHAAASSLAERGARATNVQATPERPGTTLGRWEFPDGEENVSEFNTFQERLRDTKEYQDEQTRDSFSARVDVLVNAIRESSELRSICFVIAELAVASCGDRVAGGLSDMEAAKISHDAERGDLSNEDLFSIGEGQFKLHALDQIAVAKIEELDGNGIVTDEIEIRLAYQVLLKARLGLPGVANSMLYRGCAHLTEGDVEAAGDQIEQQMKQEPLADFMAAWTPWRQTMERNHPEQYERVRLYNEPNREAISTQPPLMSDGAWMRAFDRQAADEAKQILGTTLRLTRDFAEENQPVEG